MRRLLIAATTIALLATTGLAEAAPRRRAPAVPTTDAGRYVPNRNAPGILTSSGTITSSTPNSSGNFGGPGSGGGGGGGP